MELEDEKQTNTIETWSASVLDLNVFKILGKTIVEFTLLEIKDISLISKNINIIRKEAKIYKKLVTFHLILNRNMIEFFFKIIGVYYVRNSKRG